MSDLRKAEKRLFDALREQHPDPKVRMEIVRYHRKHTAGKPKKFVYLFLLGMADLVKKGKVRMWMQEGTCLAVQV